MSTSANFDIKNTVAQQKPLSHVLDVAGNATNNSAPVFQSAGSARSGSNQYILLNSLLTQNRRIKQFENIYRDSVILNTASGVNY